MMEKKTIQSIAIQLMRAGMSTLGLGFTDESSRIDHESSCSYRSEESDIGQENNAESDLSGNNLLPYGHYSFGPQTISHTDCTDGAQNIPSVTD
ncbi:hypothetical protein CRYUN_Cryun17cG0090500 [Craigia yunnanensis]